VPEFLVEGLGPAAGNADSATVEMTATAKAHARFGYTARVERAAVTVNGQTYILDFGNNKEMQQQALKLDGKAVRLRGTLEGWQRFTSMCVSAPETSPNVTSTALREIDCLLDFLQHFEQVLEGRRFAEDHLLHLAIVLFQLRDTRVRRHNAKRTRLGVRIPRCRLREE
jgi:hypothetical protein